MRSIIRHAAIGILAVTFLVPSPARAQDAGSKSVKVYSRSGAVAARAPGLWIREALGPLDITATAGDEPLSRQQGVLIDSITTLFLALNTLIPLLPGAFGDGDPIGSAGELLITEIANNGTNTFVEVLNPGSLRIELDNWAFCNTDRCTSPAELAGRVLERGDILVVQLSGQFNGDIANQVVTLQVGTTADDVALYDFTGTARDQQDAAAMRDYLQWGDFLQSFGLEDVAVSAGLWVTQSSIDSNLSQRSFQLRAARLNSGGNAQDYIVVPFADNSLGELTPADLGPSSRARN